MPPTTEANMRNGAKIARLQLQTGQPWDRRWNWLLGRPDQPGLAARWFCAAALLFAGVNAALRLSPVFGPPESLLWTVTAIVGIVLFIPGLAYVWSTLRLHQYLKDLAG